MEFHYGDITECTANVIAENMYAQVNSDGHNSRTLDSIIDYKKDHAALSCANMYIKTKSGRRIRRQSTTSWHLLIKWKNNSTQ